MLASICGDGLWPSVGGGDIAAAVPEELEWVLALALSLVF